MASTQTLGWTFIARDRFEAVAKRVKKNTKQIAGAMADVQGQSRRASIALAKVEQGAGGVATKLRGMSLAAAAATAASIKAFGDLEEGVSNTLTLLTAPEIARYEGDLNDAAKGAVRLGFSIEDSTKGLFDYVSAMGVGEETTSQFKEAQILAKSGSASLSASVLGLTKVINAYGRDTTDAREVAVSLFAAQKKGQTTVQDLALNVGKASAMAANSGVSFKELLSTMAELSLVMGSTEEASTGVRNLIQGLINPSTEAEEVLRALGIAASATELAQAGWVPTLEQVSKIAQKNPDVLAMMFPNIRAQNAAAALTGESIVKIGDALQEIESDIKNGTGMLEAYERQMDLTNQKISEAWGAIKLLGVAIGNALRPVILLVGEAAVWATGALEEMNEWVAAVLVLAAGAATFFAAIGKGAMVVAAFVKGWGLLMAGVHALAPILYVVGAALVATVGLVPLLIGLAVAAVAAAIAFLVVKWDWVKEKYNAVKSWLGFGGDEGDIDVSGNANVNQSARLDANINIAAPAGVVQETSSRTSGTGAGLNVGMNLQESM